MKSVGAYVWAEAMEKPFVVRGYDAARKISNEVLGKFASLDEAREFAADKAGAVIRNAISGKEVA